MKKILLTLTLAGIFLIGSMSSQSVKNNEINNSKNDIDGSNIFTIETVSEHGVYGSSELNDGTGVWLEGEILDSYYLEKGTKILVDFETVEGEEEIASFEIIE